MIANDEFNDNAAPTSQTARNWRASGAYKESQARAYELVSSIALDLAKEFRVHVVVACRIISIERANQSLGIWLARERQAR